MQLDGTSKQVPRDVELLAAALFVIDEVQDEVLNRHDDVANIRSRFASDVTSLPVAGEGSSGAWLVTAYLIC